MCATAFFEMSISLATTAVPDALTTHQTVAMLCLLLGCPAVCPPVCPPACRHGGEAADVATAAVAIITDLLNMTINW